MSQHNLPDPVISYSGLEETDGITDYIYKKLSKVSNFISDTANLKINIKADKGHKNVHENIYLNIKVVDTHGHIMIEENGYELYKVIDKATDILKERLIKIKEKIKSHH